MLVRAMLPLIFVCAAGSFAFASDPVTVSQAVADPPTLMASVTPLPAIEVVHMPADFEAPSRGTALPILYQHIALLQSYDAVTTLRGVSVGGVEANPVMTGVSRSPAAMWAVKVGVTTASIVAAERLWQQAIVAGHRRHGNRERRHGRRGVAQHRSDERCSMKERDGFSRALA